VASAERNATSAREVGEVVWPDEIDALRAEVRNLRGKLRPNRLS
jgi:hypothetical protein